MTVRTLVLMRHGKSGYPPGVWDHDRPLADRGIREAALAGEWMSDDGLNVDMTLCSTATRTRQTLMRTGVDAPTIFIDDIYGGSPFEILEAIRIHVPHDAATVLVVGHEPGISALGAHLVGRPSFPPFRPGQVTLIEDGVARWSLSPDRLEIEPILVA